MGSVEGCRLCAARRGDSDPAALAWTRDRDEADGRLRWLCPACTRRHARDIESRLGVEWW